MPNLLVGTGRALLNARKRTLRDILKFSPLVWQSAGLYTGTPDVVAQPDNIGTAGGAFSQATSSKRPTFRAAGVNDKPSFQYDGTDCLTLASVAIGTTFTAIFAMKSSAAGIIYEHGASADSVGCRAYGAQFNFRVRTDGSNDSLVHASDTLGSDDVLKIVAQEWNATNASHAVYINGVSQSLAQTINAGTAASNRTATLFLGERNESQFASTMHLPEFLLFTPALSAGSRSAVEALLNAWLRVY